jgi:hypothetical protein
MAEGDSDSFRKHFIHSLVAKAMKEPVGVESQDHTISYVLSFGGRRVNTKCVGNSIHKLNLMEKSHPTYSNY